MVFKEDSFILMYPQMRKLNQAHWDEVKGIEGQCPLDINTDMYLALESQGILTMTGAYKGKDLIGYVSCTKSEHPHHRGKMFAATDAFYVSPKHRGVNGTKLIRFTEKLLKDKYNVEYFQIIVNTNFDVGPWAKRMGYSASDVIYMKKLED